MSVSVELENLLSKQAITEAIYRYCRSMDRIDVELGYSVWHEDAIADYGAVFSGTGKGFIDWVSDFHRGIVSHHHQVSNILITVEKNNAISESYVTVALFLNDSEKGLMQVRGRGRYLDKWSFKDNRWAIDKRQFVLDFATIAPAVEETPRWGKRDKTDPSYLLSNVMKIGV